MNFDSDKFEQNVVTFLKFLYFSTILSSLKKGATKTVMGAFVAGLWSNEI